MTTAARPSCAWYSYRAAGTSHRLYVHVSMLVPFWHAYDVAAALDIPREDLDLDSAIYLPGWEDENGEPAPFVPTAYVQQLGADNLDFLERVDWILSCAAAGAVELPTRTASRSRAEVVDLVDVRADTFSVATAARILDRDPTINTGRDALFDSLRTLGLVTKENDGAFVPTTSAIATGVLARNDIWVPNTKIAYNKIRITRHGLDHLHDSLGGTASINLDAPETPALIEVNP